MTTFVDRHRSDFDWNNGALGVESFADFLWRDHAGHNVLWATTTPITTLPTVPPDWHVKATADFNVSGTGNSDILWQNDNGALAIWQMSGATVIAISALPNPGPTWHLVGDNDFFSDGASSDEILFQHDTGALVIWTQIDPATGTVFGGTFTGTQNPGPTWHVVGTGDTDGDERAGILWQNNNGALVLWENATFPGNTFTFRTVAALPSVDASWHVKGMADLSGDGRADIVFQNDSGAVATWEMGGGAGTTVTAVNLVNLNPGPSWHIVGLRNIDADGQADILFQNDNGAVAGWADYRILDFASSTFDTVFPLIPNPNPNGHVWDLL